ncbi:TonB system transport protein TonB, partial [Escherichia coli]|nr:TonB system transport protein TonB [Escherichia coli]
MTLDLPRRFPWPTLLSVCIHGAVVADHRSLTQIIH